MGDEVFREVLRELRAQRGPTQQEREAATRKREEGEAQERRRRGRESKLRDIQERKDKREGRALWEVHAVCAVATGTPLRSARSIPAVIELNSMGRSERIAPSACLAHTPL